MADAAQRQRKIAAKAARRKTVVAEKKKLETPSVGVVGRIRVASKGPIVRCVVPSVLFEIGIGHVVVARALPSGLLGCGYFLIDPFCLGVKDAFYIEIGENELQSRLDAQDEMQKFIDVEPAYARKLVRDAAAYAANLGLAAAKDTPAVEAIFGDVDASSCTEAFAFGRDGKPYYVSGPLDTPQRIRLVTRTLQERCGAGGWDYLVEVARGL
jgi:hypothetical protein